jgi:hypothetical protein
MPTTYTCCVHCEVRVPFPAHDAPCPVCEPGEAAPTE